MLEPPTCATNVLLERMKTQLANGDPASARAAGGDAKVQEIRKCRERSDARPTAGSASDSFRRGYSPGVRAACIRENASRHVFVAIQGFPGEAMRFGSDAEGRFELGGFHGADQVVVWAEKMGEKSAEFGPVTIGDTGLQEVLLRLAPS